MSILIQADGSRIFNGVSNNLAARISRHRGMPVAMMGIQVANHHEVGRREIQDLRKVDGTIVR